VGGDEPAPWGQGKALGHPVLRVVGVGGAGVNAVNRMVEAEVAGVEFLALNTDLQSLQQSTADITLHIGPEVTRGLGAGSNPDLGRAAAMDDYDRIKALLKGSDMVFIAAGTSGAGGGAHRPRGGGDHGGHRHQAVRLRGLAARRGGRRGHRDAG
jgi:cell division protein FtsZ